VLVFLLLTLGVSLTIYRKDKVTGYAPLDGATMTATQKSTVFTHAPTQLLFVDIISIVAFRRRSLLSSSSSFRMFVLNPGGHNSNSGGSSSSWRQNLWFFGQLGFYFAILRGSFWFMSARLEGGQQGGGEGNTASTTK